MERLQKVIARSGICSRRKAEELILEGKVYVNGELCTTLGTKVSGNDEIEVDGKLLELEDKVYYVINKPKGCICSSNDDRDRRTVLDYLDIPQRVYTVGRLDYDTSGVLLLTNDGDFCNQMIHPRYHLPKTYVVNLQGTLTQDDIRLLRKGLKTNIGDFQPAKVKVISNDVTRDRTIFELTIMEGKNHQVKNMMEALGHQVRKLHRVRFGSIEVNDLKPGEYRRLKPYEVKQLKLAAQEGKTMKQVFIETDANVNQKIMLNEKEAHHLFDVLRTSDKETIRVVTNTSQVIFSTCATKALYLSL